MVASHEVLLSCCLRCCLPLQVKGSVSDTLRSAQDTASQEADRVSATQAVPAAGVVDLHLSAPGCLASPDVQPSNLSILLLLCTWEEAVVLTVTLLDTCSLDEWKRARVMLSARVQCQNVDNDMWC